MEFTKTITFNLEELRMIRRALVYYAFTKAEEDKNELFRKELLRLAGYVLYE